MGFWIKFEWSTRNLIVGMIVDTECGKSSSQESVFFIVFSRRTAALSIRRNDLLNISTVYSNQSKLRTCINKIRHHAISKCAAHYFSCAAPTSGSRIFWKFHSSGSFWIMVLKTSPHIAVWLTDLHSSRFDGTYQTTWLVGYVLQYPLTVTKSAVKKKKIMTCEIQRFRIHNGPRPKGFFTLLPHPLRTTTAIWACHHWRGRTGLIWICAGNRKTERWKKHFATLFRITQELANRRQLPITSFIITWMSRVLHKTHTWIACDNEYTRFAILLYLKIKILRQLSTIIDTRSNEQRGKDREVCMRVCVFASIISTHLGKEKKYVQFFYNQFKLKVNDKISSTNFCTEAGRLWWGEGIEVFCNKGKIKWYIWQC